MQKVVEKKGRKIVIRAHPHDVGTQLRGIAARLASNEHATLTQRERDLIIVAIAQQYHDILL